MQTDIYTCIEKTLPWHIYMKTRQINVCSTHTYRHASKRIHKMCFAFLTPPSDVFCSETKKKVSNHVLLWVTLGQLVFKDSIDLLVTESSIISWWGEWRKNRFRRTNCSSIAHRSKLIPWSFNRKDGIFINWNKKISLYNSFLKDIIMNLFSSQIFIRASPFFGDFDRTISASNSALSQGF